MRVVSLVPAGTEIAVALGALSDLVAVTHDCDYPAEVRALPRVTRTTIAADADGAAIDAAVREAAERGDSTFHLDHDALRRARPDVMLGQSLCRVCAVTLEQLPRAWDRPPRVVPLAAASLEGIFEDIHAVASALGREREGDALVERSRARLARVRAAIAGREPRRVACLEWIAPPFNAGHWVPEQVACAGGVDVLGTAGTRSRELSWNEVAAAAPDVIVVMLCGFDARRGRRELAATARLPQWSELDAARRGDVYVVDGNAYFSRPGPRVVDGVEVLASLLHPGSVDAPSAATVLRIG